MNNALFSSKILWTIEQATSLEMAYKEMLLQGDEVDQRIQLWREAIEFCNRDPECTLYVRDESVTDGLKTCYSWPCRFRM
jgi:hypothetical protein